MFLLLVVPCSAIATKPLHCLAFLFFEGKGDWASYLALRSQMRCRPGSLILSVGRYSAYLDEIAMDYLPGQSMAFRPPLVARRSRAG
jgi:hypothetical protein